MTREEIKLRQMTNQYLVNPSKKMTVVKDLCGVQAQFFVNAVHSIRIRTNDFDESTFSDGLVKNWTVRGTVHVFAESDLDLFMHCNKGRDYLNSDWGGYHFESNCDKWALTPQRQKFFSEIIVSYVKNAAQTRDNLKKICRQNGMTEPEEECMFDSWGGGMRELCMRGFINYVAQEKKAYKASPYFSPIPEDKANLEIARRYFTNMAPATINDAMYYFHATSGQVKAWLDLLPVENTVCDGKTYYYIENGKQYNENAPECVLLAGFDQLMLAYQKKESLFINPEYIRGIFNLAGIVMPPILLRGNVVGKWQKKNGNIVFTLFENISEYDRKIIVGTAEKCFSDIKRTEWK